MGTTAKDVLGKLDPPELWRYFAELTAIPRPSKHEGKVRDWVLALAKQHGWKHRDDAVGNIVIDVPASAGAERAAPVVLQSHLDMVCEKNADVDFNFDKDPLRIRVVGDEVRATGTTLGADNGIGVCAALAVATSKELKRPPLELLFTIDEETGLTGATAISPDLVKARRLINLDSEEDDTIYIGCAGGRTTTLSHSFPLSAAGSGEQAVAVTISGLRGGHSGGDIHECRGNAIKLLARTLAKADFPLRVASFAGGNKHNAIPREARAELLVARGDLPKLKQLLTSAQTEAVKLLAGVDEGVKHDQSDITAAAPSALSADHSKQLVHLLSGLPDGVLGMSRAIKGLVESSNNIAVIAWELNGSQAAVKVVASSRSSSAPHLTAVMDQVAGVARLAGWKAEQSDGYPGWQPNPKSKLLSVCESSYQKLFNEKPHVTAIHAGLECGVIGERVGGMDMISFGPTIKGAHSPDEYVSIKSVQKFWKFLSSVLASLAA